MRILKFTILLLLLMCPLILNAQYSGFDLSRYKLPDIKLTRLDAYINLGNTANRYHYKPSYSDSTESRQDNFRGTLNFDYNHFRNSEKYQGEFYALASGSSNNYKSENENTNSISNSNNINFMISNINRFYNQNLNFIEIDPAISVSGNKAHNESTAPSYDNTNNHFITTLSLPISIGHGRIEPVEDLRLAIYILEELNKAGRIDSLPSDNVVLEMAMEISKIRRQRFFDARIRKIRELQVVDSFLIANNIVSSNDINYFAVLNDQWDYASGPERTAGFAVNIGIDDHIILNRSHRQTSNNGADTDIRESENTYYIAGFSQIRYDKPVNLQWQTSAALKVSYGFEFTRDPQNQMVSDENIRTDIFNTMLEYSIRFLPNSRTSAELSLAGNYYNLKRDWTISNPDPVDFQIRDNELTVNAGLNMYYYISPQFRLQVNSSFNFYRLHDLNSGNSQPSLTNLTNSFHNNFGITLIYSIF